MEGEGERLSDNSQLRGGLQEVLGDVDVPKKTDRNCTHVRRNPTYPAFPAPCVPTMESRSVAAAELALEDFSHKGAEHEQAEVHLPPRKSTFPLRKTLKKPLKKMRSGASSPQNTESAACNVVMSSSLL